MNESLPFSELYIEIIKGLFFKHPDMEFTINSMHQHVSLLYPDQRYIPPALHILLVRKVIVQTRDILPQTWIASGEKISQIEDDKKTERDGKKADLKVKQLTIQRFNWPYIISISSVVVALASLMISGYNLYVTTHPKKLNGAKIRLQATGKMHTDTINLKINLGDVDSLKGN